MSHHHIPFSNKKINLTLASTFKLLLIYEEKKMFLFFSFSYLCAFIFKLFVLSFTFIFNNFFIPLSFFAIKCLDQE